MNAAEARHRAKDWVAAYRDQWPGLQAAHLVGGLTTMPDDAPFPAYKDVDLHLIVDEDSALLTSGGPFQPIIEMEYAGLMVEAGVKSLREYASPEAVLGNPEIAYHLTVDSVLDDPQGLLAGLQETVRREYPRRRWVQARVDAERRDLDQTLTLLPMARRQRGLSGAFLLLGYSFTYVAAALAVAALRPPRIGSHMLVHLRGLLEEYGRAALCAEILDLFNPPTVTPTRVEALLAEGLAAFDLAVRVRRTPHPFGHKLHPHQRPYFVESCRDLLAAGHHREALAWLSAYTLSCGEIILADGPEEVKPIYAARQDAFLAELGYENAAAFDREERARTLQAVCFALADTIVATHPSLRD